MTRLLLALLACLLFATSVQAEPIDLNTASQAELETLPGIGPAKAAAIIAYREAQGPFTTPIQIDAVPGIGPATLSQILPLVTVGGSAAAVPSATPAAHEDNAPTPTSAAKPRSSRSSGLGLQIESPEADAPAPAASARVPEEPAAGGHRININTAGAGELDELPGIGASKAAAIVADREQNGPFKSCAELDRVQGIGPTTVANLEAMCTVK
jgi:competence protein ComEA